MVGSLSFPRTLRRKKDEFGAALVDGAGCGAGMDWMHVTSSRGDKNNSLPKDATDSQ